MVRTRGRRAAARAAAAVVLVLLTACGSTVQNRAGLRTAVGGDGLSAPDGTGSGGGAADPGAVAADAGLGGGGVTGTGSATSGGTKVTTRGGTSGTAGTVATTKGPLPKTGPGWDENYIYIGVTTQKDVQRTAQSLNLAGLDAGDQEGEANAIADELNRRGGLFGRKIKIVFRDQNTVQTAQDPNTVGTATCRYYTEDRPVVAVLNPVTLMDVTSFRGCFAKAKVPLFSASVAAVDAKVGADLAPYFYQAVAPTWDALAPVLVRELQGQGWFNGWNARTGTAMPGQKAKVGILVNDDEVGARVAGIVTRALASVGNTDPVVFQYTGTDFSSAVLQFSGRGVTHVIVTSADLLGFELSASSQSYRPRYGITSYNAPQTFLENNGPKDQQPGSLGVGWSPSLDTSDANDPGDTSPAEPECLNIYKKAGQTFAGKRLAEGVAFAFCDGLRLIVQGAQAGGGLSGAAISQGIQQIAPSFNTAFSFANGLGPTRLFIPGAVRRLAWEPSCSCFKYASAVNAKL